MWLDVGLPYRVGELHWTVLTWRNGSNSAEQPLGELRRDEHSSIHRDQAVSLVRRGCGGMVGKRRGSVGGPRSRAGRDGVERLGRLSGVGSGEPG